MKELSIEQKAKAYDIALDKIKRLLGTGSNCSTEDLEYVFPELKESEDEKMRKELISLVKKTKVTDRYYDLNKMLAWLEKQGEQKLNPCENCGIATNNCQKFPCAIRNGEQKSEIDQHSLPVSDNSSLPTFDESIYHPCTEKVHEQKPADTKEYDFHGIKFIPKFAKGDIIKDKKCSEVSTIEGFSYDTGLYTHTYGQFPITIQDNYELVEQKSSWSEEDENHREAVIDILVNNTYSGENGKKVYSEEIDWLKSLSSHSHWKPSEGQLECLGYAIEKAEKDWTPLINNRVYLTLKALKEQLKKLREE